jgi:hypothetical protein
MLPLNLIIFCTTMGHGGRHVYKQTIDSLYSKIDMNLFANKVIHVKTRNKEENIFNEIKEYCESLGFDVIETKADLVHHSENHLNHSSEYFKDIYKIFSKENLRKIKYSLWMEDDWILNSKKISIEECIKESINFLEENPNQLCVRFNSSELFKKEDKNYFKNNKNIFTQSIDHTSYGPSFTFQPNINRTSEIFYALKNAQNYLHQLGDYHCELMITHILYNFTNSNTPFSFFDPEKIYSQHIG